MRRRLLIGLAALFYYSGLVALARWWMKRTGPYLVILNYHRASSGHLQQHLLYLRRFYRIVHIEAALEELYCQHTKRIHTHKDRRTLLAITFDDGYYDNYSYAFALAQKLQIPFTIYLVPGYMGSSRRFWWLEANRLIQSSTLRRVSMDGQSYCLHHHRQRAALARVIDRRLRFAPSVQAREADLVQIRAMLNVPSIHCTDTASLPLRWEQVEEMGKSEWVSFGAHTMHHPILACLEDRQEVQYEVQACRDILEEHLGHPIHTFAYPVGQWRHIGLTALQAVQQSGYRWALTSAYGFNTARTDPYLLKRIETDVEQHWLVVAAEAAGLWGLIARLRWIPFIRKYFTNAVSI